MATEKLYRKVLKGKRVMYEEYKPLTKEEVSTIITFTDAQCITAAGALGMMLIMALQRNFPPHKLIARKIRGIEDAIVDLYRSTGEPVLREHLDYMVDCWNETMTRMSA